jgi:hypothetical protein
MKTTFDGTESSLYYFFPTNKFPRTLRNSGNTGNTVANSIQQLACSDRKHGVHFDQPEQFLDTGAYARDTQSNLVALTADVMASQHAEA